MQIRQFPKGREIDLPISDLHAIVNHLERATNSDVVVIGGRAVNLYCINSSRFTNDVDLVLRWKPSREQLSTLPSFMHRDENNAYFEITYRGERITPEVKYYRPSLPMGFTTLDLYYPYYVSSFNNFQNRTDISGIPIETILEKSQTISIGEELTMKVPSPQILVVLKYVSWMDRGKGDPKAKDMADIRNLIRNHANTPQTFTRLIHRVGEIVNKTMPEQHHEIITGVLRNASLRGINKELEKIADDLLRMA